MDNNNQQYYGGQQPYQYNYNYQPIGQNNQ